MKRQSTLYASLLLLVVSLITRSGSAQQLQGKLTLTNNEPIHGYLTSVEGERTIGWKTELFDEPLIFPTESLKEMRLDNNKEGGEPHEAWRVNLANGSAFFGEWVEANERDFVFESERFGRLSVPRQQIASLRQLQESGLRYMGPRTALEWHPTKNSQGEASWAFHAGTLVSQGASARLFREIGLDQQVTLDLELRWKDKPSFSIGLGVNSVGDDGGGFRIEVWGDQIVGFQKLADRLDTFVLAELDAKVSSFRVLVSVDPVHKVAWVRSSDGSELAEFRFENPWSSGLSLVDFIGDLEFPSVEVRSWSDVATVERKQFTLTWGIVEGVDLAQGKIALAGGAPAIDLASVESMRFSDALLVEPDFEVEVQYTDGSLLRGELLAADPESLRLSTPWGKEPVLCSTDRLQRLWFPRNRLRRVRNIGLATLGSQTSKGELQGWSAETQRFLWKPALANNTVPLERKSGKIELGEVSTFFAGSRKGPHQVDLRDGDTYPCCVRALTPTHLVIDSVWGEGQEIPLQLIKAIEFDRRRAKALTQEKPGAENENNQRIRIHRGGAVPAKSKDDFISEERREHLLAVPRKDKSAPPPHLVIAKNGDAVRGEITSLGDDHLVIKSQLRERRLRRSAIASIIWLSPDPEEKVVAKPQGESSEPPEGELKNAFNSWLGGLSQKVNQVVADTTGNIRYQLILDARTRLTIEPLAIEGKKIKWRNPTLGTCWIETSDVTTILMGAECGSRQSYYAEWVHKPMKEPFPEDETAASGDSNGRDIFSGMGVGDAVPEVELTTLSGDTVKLSSFKGKTVLLNFWFYG